MKNLLYSYFDVNLVWSDGICAPNQLDLRLVKLWLFEVNSVRRLCEIIHQKLMKFWRGLQIIDLTSIGVNFQSTNPGNRLRFRVYCWRKLVSNRHRFDIDMIQWVLESIFIHGVRILNADLGWEGKKRNSLYPLKRMNRTRIQKVKKWKEEDVTDKII